MVARREAWLTRHCGLGVPCLLLFAGAAKTTLAATGHIERRDDVECHLGDGYDNQLRDTFHRLNREFRIATIPSRDKYLALIIGVDQAHEIPQDDAVFVAKP